MTLKEKVAATNPGRVEDKYMGGVRSCPDRYVYLSGHFDGCICEGKDNVTREECEICWNQKFIERKEEKQ